MSSAAHFFDRHAAGALLFLAVLYAGGGHYGLVRWRLASAPVPAAIPAPDWEAEYPFPAGLEPPPRVAASPSPADDETAAPAVRFKAQVQRRIQRIEAFARENALLRIPLSEANMAFRRFAGMRLFPDADDVLRLNNGWLDLPSVAANVDYDADQIAALRDLCAARGMGFLYVAAPGKCDRLDTQLPAGFADFTNPNVDRFAARLAERGVPCLDLREPLRRDFADRWNVFFRTDHHWKPEAGLWAADQIAAELNRRFDFGIPAGLLAPTNYAVEVRPAFFLGSLGKKVTRAYVAPDDFSLLTPKFESRLSLVIPTRRVRQTGSFRRALIDARQIARRNLYGRNPYAAYLYGDSAFLAITNHLRPDGRRLLVVKDSTANVVLPFLALGTAALEAVDLRHFNGSLRALIDRRRPDAVVVLYGARSIRTTTPATPRNGCFRLE
ncbi:MAG TPA: hypothetical protein PK388_09100 [Kiritimatiellia bacterium]|nr:hypothetical protein [Kiritimatiellia bacterium]